MIVMPWSAEELQAEVSSPDWGGKVLEALRNYFSDRGWLLEPAQLVEADLEFEPDGTPVLVAIYDHPHYDRRIGLRHRLDDYPMAIPEGSSPAEAMAQDIAVYEISEPLGRYSEILVDDGDGVWWWGDGFPELSKNPNAPWFSDLPPACWQKMTDVWTVATGNDQVCGSVAVADGPVMERPTVLMPPRQVHCVRQKGHIGVHGSASRSNHPDGSELEVFAWD